MNTRLTLNLICKLPRQSQRGFALPMAIMVGLVVVIAGAAMMIRAQGDQNSANSQSATQIADAAAEAGLTQITDFVARNPAAAVTNKSGWGNQAMLVAAGATTTTTTNTTTRTVSSTTSLIPNDCPAVSTPTTSSSTETSSTTTTTSTPNSVQNISSFNSTASNPSSPVQLQASANSSQSPYYYLKDYQWRNGIAHVVVVGMAGANGSSKSVKYVTFPVAKTPTTDRVTESGLTGFPAFIGGFASLWVKTISNGDLNNVNVNVLSSSNTTPSEVNANTKCFYNNKQRTPHTYITTSLAMPNSPDTPSSNVNTIDLNTPSSKVVLPLQADIDATTKTNYNETTKRYQYKAANLNFNGQGVKLEFRPGYKVTLWVEGNIDPGTADIESLAAKPTDALIIGNATASPTISLSGNGSVCNVFVWASNYNASINGGGGGSPNKYCDKPANSDAVSPNNTGIFWVNRFTGTSSDSANQNVIAAQDATLWPDVINTANSHLTNPVFGPNLEEQVTTTVSTSQRIALSPASAYQSVSGDFTIPVASTTTVSSATTEAAALITQAVKVATTDATEAAQSAQQAQEAAAEAKTVADETTNTQIDQAAQQAQTAATQAQAAATQAQAAATEAQTATNPNDAIAHADETSTKKNEANEQSIIAKAAAAEAKEARSSN